MVERYLTIYKGGVGELIEKKSRFIATVHPVETEEEALAFVEEIKKKYWDAVNNLGNFLSVDGIFKLHYMEKNSIDEDEFNLLGKKSEYLLIRNINNGFIIWYNDERCYKEFHKSAPILK